MKRYLFVLMLMVFPWFCLAQADPIVLIEANDDFRLLNLLNSKGFIDADVRAELELSMIRKLMMLRSTNTEVSSLRGPALSGICKLVTYATKTQFAAASMKSKELAGIALVYATSLGESVYSQVNDAQRTLGGTGCQVGAGNA